MSGQDGSNEPQAGSGAAETVATHLILPVRGAGPIRIGGRQYCLWVVSGKSAAWAYESISRTIRAILLR
jgi:hypothetical protein